MDPLIHLLHLNSNRSPSELAQLLGLTEDEVIRRTRAAEADGKGGFDRLARRIAKFDQVRECFLMSGGYDLAVVVEGQDLLDVANFVAEKLSTLGGVLSTATHFQLKAYKQSGFLVNPGDDEERLPVSP